MNETEDSITDSGKIRLECGNVCYESRDYGTWSLPVSTIRIVGEFTNDHGPHLDDYFLVFVTEATGEWRTASFYAKGRDEFLDKLASALPGVSSLALANSTDWKSRVLWPKELQGRPLFEFIRPTHGAGFFGRIAAKLDSGIELRVAEDVLSFIREIRG